MQHPNTQVGNQSQNVRRFVQSRNRHGSDTAFRVIAVLAMLSSFGFGAVLLINMAIASLPTKAIDEPLVARAGLAGLGIYFVLIPGAELAFIARAWSRPKMRNTAYLAIIGLLLLQLALLSVA